MRSHIDTIKSKVRNVITLAHFAPSQLTSILLLAKSIVVPGSITKKATLVCLSLNFRQSLSIIQVLNLTKRNSSFFSTAAGCLVFGEYTSLHPLEWGLLQVDWTKQESQSVLAKSVFPPGPVSSCRG
jgi:hypothetical protein